MATAADLERYLRRLGEDELLGESSGRLVAAIQALVAVDAFDEALGDEVLLEYDGAAALRAGEYFSRAALRAAPPPGPPAPRRGGTPAEVVVASRPERDPALRHLRWLALGDEGEAFDAAHEALVVARALRPGTGAVAELDTALAAMHGFWTTYPREPPEPWRSLRRATRADPPVGVIALAAATPELDGLVVAVHALESRPDDWRLEVEVAGLDPVPRARRRALAWWAADERGQQYRGALAGGEVRFAPPLDPAAERLEVSAIGECHQAVIRFPLEWP